MSNHARSLACSVPWTRLLLHLGMKCGTSRLPATVGCPLCREKKGTLRVYRDFLLNAEWLYCHTCRFAGDIIEFAAAVWDVEVAEAVERLRRKELLLADLGDDRVELYLDQVVGLRERLREFEQNSVKHLTRDNDGGLYPLLRKFRVERLVGESRWLNHGSTIVWGAGRREVEDLIHPMSYEETLRQNHNGNKSIRRGSGAGRSRIFKGSGWGDVLVVPHYDLPGRVCGLTILGRNGDVENGDVLFRPLQIGGNRRATRECGVSSLRNLIGKPHKDFGDTVFVIADPFVALDLQLWHYEGYDTPLPIVGSALDERFVPRHVFDQLPTRRLIFWAPKRDYRLFRQAKACNGIVSRLSVTSRQLRRQPGLATAKAWLYQIAKRADPWQDVLLDDLDQLDDFDAQNLLSGLDLTTAELDRITADFDSDTVSRAERLNMDAVRQQRVTINNQTIIEASGKWSLEESGEEICNGVVRIEETVQTHAGRSYYSGWAQISGCELRNSFVLNSDRVHKRGLLPCVRDVLLADRKTPQTLNFNRRFAKDSLNIALQFHEPKTTYAADRVGWCEDGDTLFLPQFSLDWPSDVADGSFVVESGESVPAADWEPPESSDLGMRSAVLTEDAPDVALLWAVAACVAERIISGLHFKRPHPVVIEGSSADAAMVAAEVLGCLRSSMLSPRSKVSVDDVIYVCEKHELPTVLPIRTWTDTASAVLCSRRTDSVVVNGSRLAAKSLCTQGRWHVIRSKERVQYIRDEVQDAARQLLPRYLKHALGRATTLYSSTQSEPFIHRIFRDMTAWLEPSGSDTSVIQRAQSLLTAAGTQAPFEVYQELLFKFVKSGDIRVTLGVELVAGEHMQVHIDERTRKAWIPKEAVSRVLAQKKAPPIDNQAITTSMREHLMVEGEHELGDVPGWVVPLVGEWQKLDRMADRSDQPAAAPC